MSLEIAGVRHLRSTRAGVTFVLAALFVGACTNTPERKTIAAAPPKPRAGLDEFRNPDPFPSTYDPGRPRTMAITNATIYDGTGRLFEGATLVLENGRVSAIGSGVAIPAGAERIDGTGRFVTPGIIDGHTHMGVFPSPSVQGHADGNENVDPNTAQVWAEHSIWPQDPAFDRARASGVTSLLVLPGSANLFGGRSVTIKNVPAVTEQAMKFPGAPYGLKMACGENPKGRYGSRGRSPATRMGNVAGFRRAWIEAADYARRWANFRTKGGEVPKRDLALDTEAGVLDGRILVQNHCYRADEMSVMIDVAKEFGYKITAFHHAPEAYKIKDQLAKEGICVAIWSQRWGFKMEAYDGIEENAAILHKSGVCVVIHSDEAELAQRLNVEAAVAIAAGRRVGIDVPPAEAIKWITSNPARMMGIADRTGSLEVGKAADAVLWNKDPFSIYAMADKVFIDGTLRYDRLDPRTHHVSDFELGQEATR
ncbi:amidohydrolase family protein [Roseomonas aeriglobus]|nr:amidohydrolase family protein [Roseomonas aeriglobus]